MHKKCMILSMPTNVTVKLTLVCVSAQGKPKGALHSYRRATKRAHRAAGVNGGDIAKSTMQGIGSGVLGTLGTDVLGPIGGIAGGWLGKTIGGGISSLFGFGAYSGKPSSVKGISTSGINGTSGPPYMAGKGRAGQTSTIICHREYIQDIVCSTGFVNNNFFCNPGLGETFPWLSKIAQNYEEYEWIALAFQFRSNSASALNSTNTALGSVVMSADYNANAPNFTNKQQVCVYM